MKLALFENFHAAFYIPFYVLKALRFADKEGLEIDWLPPGPPGAGIEAVQNGTVDLTWGGPMRVMKDRDTHPETERSLVCFSQVITRDPFCLVGRAPAPFRLEDLANLRMSLVSEVPTPWLCLQADLANHGLDIRQLQAQGRLVTDLTMQQQVEALAAGKIDVVQLFEPFVSQIEAAGQGNLLYAATSRGVTLYTTFIASKAGAVRNAPAFAALDRAVAAMQQWLFAATPDEIADVVEGLFPGVARSILISVIQRYRSTGVWSSQKEVSVEAFDRLADCLLRGGFIRSPGSFTDCVVTL